MSWQRKPPIVFRFGFAFLNFFHSNIISHHVFLESNGSVFIWISWPYPYTFAAFQRKKGQIPEKGDGHALISRSHHFLCLSVLHFFFLTDGLFAWVQACECYFLAKRRRETVSSLNLVLFRLGVADDIGGAVSFLSSDQASYITGETLVIAGGLQSRLWKNLR